MVDNLDQVKEIDCPHCNYVTPVPSIGIQSLQSGHRLNQCEESGRPSLSPVPSGTNRSTRRSASYSPSHSPSHSPKRCSTAHSHERHSLGQVGSRSLSLKANLSDSRVPTEVKTMTIYCSEHAGKEMELFCMSCDEPICLKCAIKGNKHFKHEYEEINKASKRVKRELIRTSLKPVETQLITATDLLNQINSRCTDISERQEIIEKSINDTITQRQKELEARKTELVAQLHQMTLGKLRALATQREKIEATQTELGSSVGSMRKSLSASSRQVLMMRTSMPQVGEQSSNLLQPDMLKPITESDMVFAFPEDFKNHCETYGKVSAISSPDPSKCYITNKSLESMISSLDKGTVVLQVLNYDGKPCRGDIKSIESELTSEITDAIFTCSVEKAWKHGQYKIGYQPSSKGKHRLHVKVEGHHIQGSPFRLNMKTSVKDLGPPVLSFGGLKSPRGIAINRKSEIIIAEEDASCISIYSPKGEKIRSFGLCGSGEGQFKSPRGVTVDNDGNIYVADSNNHRIQKFSSEGRFIMASNAISSSDNTGLLQPSYPTGIAYNYFNGKLYMVDINHAVQVLNPDLTLHGVFGKKGKDKGQFLSPWNITCDETGNVYVADTSNHRIQVFTSDGKFLRKFGSQGSGKGELSWPDGIAVQDGSVFVSEYRNYRISIFTCEGQFISSFGSSGGDLGEFKDPFGVTVDSSGLVYVCDCGNNRVQVFCVCS